MTALPTPSLGPESDEMLRKEARAWVRLLMSGQVSQWDALAFNRWRGSSDRHGAAFAEARKEWQLMKPAIGQVLAGDGTVVRRADVARAGRRAFFGAAAGAAATAAVAVIHPPFGLWPAVDQWGADFDTGPGEQRHVVVADRVDIVLNTRTRVRREVADGRPVGIEVLDGETAIDMETASGPFVVRAAAGTSTGSAARFQVRRTGGRACVTCLAGTVRVEHPAGTRVLAAGQQISYDGRLLEDTVAVRGDDAAAWRKGMLVFRQDRLADVIAEINRYRAGRVVLLADALSDSAVSGRFSIKELDAALLQIQHSFSLTARALPGGVVILS
ncbi:FecR domain-containing protein [Pigmentiphaga sp. YJ18]|uniref:FecR family protein n=1 Tax=Pigmentiphaga sp. YJ18 TaxID=3134907 RepID=UPI00310E9742